MPSLAALEKRVHVSDPYLLPQQVIVEYELSDNTPRRMIEIGELPANWTVHETQTQRIGNRWLDSLTEVLLYVPSVIMPIASAPDRNVLINHRVAKDVSIKIAQITAFTLDPRLFRP